MRIDRRVNLELHITSPPRSIRAGGIDKADSKLIQIFEGAGDRLTGSERDRDLRFCVPGIKHSSLEFKALVTRSDSCEITGQRVTGGTSTRAVEVLFAG